MQEKASRNEFTNALNAYTRAAEVNPDDFARMLGMAQMFRRLNRYREAIALYEKAFDASKRADTAISVLLALTYVSGGDDEKATNTLRAGGISEDEIGARIQESRARSSTARVDVSGPVIARFSMEGSHVITRNVCLLGGHCAEARL